MMAPSRKVGAVRWMTLLLTIIAVWCVGVGMGESTAYLSSFLHRLLAADASYQDICFLFGLEAKKKRVGTTCFL